MKTVASIINLHGGTQALRDQAIRIDSPGWMRLCIECVGPGPRGHEQISIAHYYEQNGDLLPDPDVVFEVPVDADGMVSDDLWEWGPISIQHSYGPVVRAVFTNEQGLLMIHPRIVKDIREFARVWDRNIRDQSFLDAFRATSKK